jgi:Methyltransferase domain
MERLSRLSAWPGQPGGWQYPFDLGFGIVTPTYTPVQAVIQPWRRKVLLENLDSLFADKYGEISVLDLASCEGWMAEGLWERGVRNITCVEACPINIQKAQFVAKVKGYNLNIIEAEIADYLRSETRTYDLVLAMDILHLLLDPFSVSKLIAARTRTLAVFDTPLAPPTGTMFKDSAHHEPPDASFVLRIMFRCRRSGGLRNLELSPTPSALRLLLLESDFVQSNELEYGTNPFPAYSLGERGMYFAYPRNAVSTQYDKQHWARSYGLVQTSPPHAEADPFFVNLLNPRPDPFVVDLIGRDLSDILCDATQPPDTIKHASYYMAQVHEYRGEWDDMTHMLEASEVPAGRDEDHYDYFQHKYGRKAS